MSLLLLMMILSCFCCCHQAQSQQAAASASAGSSDNIFNSIDVALPLWAQTRSSDIQLDFSKADAPDLQQQQDQPVTFRGLPLNVTHRQGPYHGNVAVVRFGSQFVLAVRKIQFYLSPRNQLPDYPRDADPSESAVKL
jgi:hypothetical protein